MPVDHIVAGESANRGEIATRGTRKWSGAVEGGADERVAGESRGPRVTLLVRRERLILHSAELSDRNTRRNDSLRCQLHRLRKDILDGDNIRERSAEARTRRVLCAERIHRSRDVGAGHGAGALGEKTSRERRETILRRRLAHRTRVDDDSALDDRQRVLLNDDDFQPVGQLELFDRWKSVRPQCARGRWLHGLRTSRDGREDHRESHGDDAHAVGLLAPKAHAMSGSRRANHCGIPAVPDWAAVLRAGT